MATSPVETYTVVGIRENVSDFIGLISPWDTPVYSQSAKEDCHNTMVQYQEDSLRAPVANAKVEGTDPTVISDYDPTIMRTNYTQILEESASVTGTMQAVDLYGRSNEMDYQVLKKGRSLRRDIEHALVGTKQTAVAGDASTARQLAGCQAQISAATTDDNGAVPRDLDEAQVLAVLESCYTLGGEPNQMLVTPSHATAVAGWAYKGAGIDLGRSRDIENERRIVNVIDLYVSPYGSVSVVIDKWLAADNLLLLQTDAWTIPELRPIGQTPLAKTGDTDKTLINCELTLRHLNQNASGQVVDLNP